MAAGQIETAASECRERERWGNCGCRVDIYENLKVWPALATPASGGTGRLLLPLCRVTSVGREINGNGG